MKKFFKDPLSKVPVPGGITDITGIRDELMIATKDGHILR